MGTFIIIIIIIVVIIIYSNTNSSSSTTYKPPQSYKTPTESAAEKLARDIKLQQKLEKDKLFAVQLQKEKEEKEKIEQQKIQLIFNKKNLYNNNLLKENWKEYNSILLSNDISTLYHFTDRSNIQSIKNHGGLYSWEFCVNNNILISMPGGDDLSRSLDRRFNLQNYVRVSFSRNHPMMYVAMHNNRIKDPVILEIDTDVIYWKNSKYANKNATRRDVSIGPNIHYFRNIKFEIVKLKNHFDLDETVKPYYQAEILVLEKIPIEFIRNIDLV